MSASLIRYVAKLDFIAPECRLSTPDELLLLQQHGASDPYLAHRKAFLEACMSDGAWSPAHLSKSNAAAQSRTGDVELEAPLDAHALINPSTAPSWQKKMLSLNYNRPNEVSGPAALEWLGTTLSNTFGSLGGLNSLTAKTLSLSSDSRGFWMLYELLTDALQVSLVNRLCDL